MGQKVTEFGPSTDYVMYANLVTKSNIFLHGQYNGNCIIYSGKMFHSRTEISLPMERN